MDKWNSIGLSLLATIWIVSPLYSQNDAAEQMEKAFLSNFDSIVTCDLRVEECASSADFSAVSSVISLRKLDEFIRIDRLRRIIKEQGVEMEQMEQFWFDGKTTTEFYTRLPGLKRPCETGKDCGITCLIYDEKDERVVAPIQKALGLQTFGIGEVRPLLDAIREANSRKLVEGKEHTIVYALPDLIKGAITYKDRSIELEFASESGWWPKRIRYESTISAAQGTDKMGGIQSITKFHDLGNGRFFPASLRSESFWSDDSNLSAGPNSTVVTVSLNEKIVEADLPIAIPTGVLISTQRAKHGDLGQNSLSLRNNMGEERHFADRNELHKFQMKSQGDPAWIGQYNPLDGFPYYFDTSAKAKNLSKKMGKLSSAPNRNTGPPPTLTSGRIWSIVALGALVLATIVFRMIRRKRQIPEIA